MKQIVIAVDLMGGDEKIHVPVNGMKEFLKRNNNVKFLAFGTKESKDAITKDLVPFVEFVESETYIKSEDDPVFALRNGKNSSMYMAIKSVADGTAHASVSSGNTGALMAISKICLKTLEGIDTPAIASILPTLNNFTLFLDMGANVECRPNNFYEFAIMGQAFVSSVTSIQNPTVAILNIGTEENKGTALAKSSMQLFKEKLPPELFKGFVEGDKLMTGEVNVIVTDGYSGNIALKTMEGAGRVMAKELKRFLSGSLLGMLGYLIAKPAFRKFKDQFDKNKYNGAMFLGLNGISVKSHGSANVKGFANAINVAYKLAQNDIVSKIKNNINK